MRSPASPAPLIPRGRFGRGAEPPAESPLREVGIRVLDAERN